MRKYLTLVLMTIILSSCAIKYPYKRYSTVVDFEKYTSQGFFITESNSVNFNYMPVGSLSSVVESGYELIGDLVTDRSDDLYHNSSSSNKYGDYINAAIDDAIEELFLSAKELGADGIINLKTEYISGIYSKYGSVVRPPMYIATGMAIKRK